MRVDPDEAKVVDLKSEMDSSPMKVVDVAEGECIGIAPVGSMSNAIGREGVVVEAKTGKRRLALGVVIFLV